jgi:hypothetical protein
MRSLPGIHQIASGVGATVAGWIDLGNGKLRIAYPAGTTVNR